MIDITSKTCTYVVYILYSNPGGAAVLNKNGDKIGHVTSGCPSPTLQKNIAMAYVPNKVSKIGTTHAVEVRKKINPCKIVKMPFVPANYHFPKK